MEEIRELFSMKDVEKITKLSEHTIRNWCKEFNIQLAKTSGGHRRFTEENIKLIKAIQEKKDGSGWSMKQIGSWLNGELTPEILANAEVKANLEKKFENLDETIKLAMGELFRRLDEQDKQRKEQEIRHMLEMKAQEERIIAAVSENIQKKLADPVERRDMELMGSIRQIQQTQQLDEQRRLEEIAATKEQEMAEQELHKQKEKLGLISRFFSKIGL